MNKGDKITAVGAIVFKKGIETVTSIRKEN